MKMMILTFNNLDNLNVIDVVAAWISTELDRKNIQGPIRPYNMQLSTMSHLFDESARAVIFAY